LKVRWVKRIDLGRDEDPRGVFEQGKYLYVYYNRRIEKRSKVNGELLDEWSISELHDELELSACTAGAGKIYCVAERLIRPQIEEKLIEKGEKDPKVLEDLLVELLRFQREILFFVLSHDLKLEQSKKIIEPPWHNIISYYTQMLYHDGYIYAIRYIPGKPYVIEKRSSIDFSLISEYVHKQQGILNPVIGLNPYTGDLWVMPFYITKEKPENVINILDEDLVGKKNCSLQCLSNALFYGININFIFISFGDINFDEKGYAYLLSYILTDKAKDGIGGHYVLKYDRNGNLVSSVSIKEHCNIAPKGIVYLKDHVYVVGQDYPEGSEEVVLGVFSRNLEFLERRTIAEYYNDEVEDIRLERKHIVSDGGALYIGVEVGEKGGGRRFDLYAVSPLVEVLSVEEPRRAEAPVLRVDFTSIGIGDIVALLKQPVSGLVSGYSCADSMSLN